MFAHRGLAAGEFTRRPQIEVKEVGAGTPEALWRERILERAESGLAQVEFCREHGLSLDEFKPWPEAARRRLPPKTPLAQAIQYALTR